MKLTDQVAIITGGARGIGLAIAKRYVAEGASVVIADIDQAAGEAAAAALGAKCRFLAADVGAARDAENLIAETVRLFGRLDILVNNAAIVHGADFLDIAEADFDRVLRVNLKGAFMVGQAAARRMVADGRASASRGSADASPNVVTPADASVASAVGSTSHSASGSGESASGSRCGSRTGASHPARARSNAAVGVGASDAASV